MPKSRLQKEEEARSFQYKLSRLGEGALFFVNYRGLDVAHTRALRRAIKQLGGEFTVVKKTLARFAFKDAGIPADPKTLEGEVGFVFGYADPIQTAKILHRAFRLDEKPVILGGWFQGLLMDSRAVSTLAVLPSREVLLAKAFGSIAAPMQRTVGVLNEVIASFVRVLEAKAKVGS
jgi:large subunit ribosomal protein L10